jgi:hypothetical protein
MVLSQPSEVLVYVNMVVPGFKAVTTPALVTDATLGLLLAQVPLLTGSRKVVPPTQESVLPPTCGSGGIGPMVALAEREEEQLF